MNDEETSHGSKDPPETRSTRWLAQGFLERSGQARNTRYLVRLPSDPHVKRTRP